MVRKSREKRNPDPGRPGVVSSEAAKENDNDNPNDMIIVGIGASAGGLDAMQKLLPGLPSNAGMAFVVVQHMAPKYQSKLSSLLAKHTDMPIETIADGVRVKPDTIYITPPNKNVLFSNDRLVLTKGLDIGPKPSIDSFLNSLAEGKKAHAVGMILSGTGTDGAHGIRAIKSNDGITMAQTPDSARFDGMPQAAAETGSVDLVLPPEKIGERLRAAAKFPHLVLKLPVDKHLDEIGTILDLVNHQTGIDYSEYKKSTIQRRIRRRMAIHQFENPGEYVAFLRKHPREAAALSKDMLISVTGFFRDAGAFESLTPKLRELFETKKKGDTFRAWVPGCSTGEEAYSIAILIAVILGEDIRNYRIQIFATDIDEELIQLARKGVYPVAALTDTDAAIVEKFFSNQDNSAAVKKQIRDMVVLARQDLIKDTNFIHLDLISCRNLLIYINTELQDKLLSLFHFSLNPNGLLFLGRSESIGRRTDLFKSVDSKWKIYQRKETAARGLPELMKNRQIVELTTQRTGRQKQPDSCRLQESDFFDSLLGIMDCCAVLTDENANIHYIRGDVSPYFKLQEGNVKENLNALEMARPEIRLALQSMIYKVNKGSKSAASSTINLDVDRQGVLIKIGRIQRENFDGYLLIVFTPVEPLPFATKRGSSLQDSDHERIRELEHELALTREHLQDTTEELETSTEELQTLNEELQAANEELQATNEELETSNEELQAGNEELNTVNDELRAKSEEAAELLDNLTGSEKRYRRLVDNMNEALMLCEIEFGPDKRPVDLLIQQVNRALEELMSLKSRDLPLRAGAAQLHELVSREMLDRFDEIARGGNPQRVEIALSAIEKELTLSVYDVGEGRLGVVCRDDTQRKKSENALQQSEQRLKRAQEIAHLGSWELDLEKNELTWSDEVYRIFGLKPKQFTATYEAFLNSVHPDDRQKVDEAYSGSLRNDQDGYEVEHRVVRPDGEVRFVLEKCEHLRKGDDRITRSVGMVHDITERRQAEAALRRSAQFPEENPHPVLRIAADGTLLYENAAARSRLAALNWKNGERLPQPLAATVGQARGRDDTVESELTFSDGRTFGFYAIQPKGEDYTNLYGIDLTERRRIEDALRRSKERIRASLAEKEVLLKEIHHRVKNNMQVISSLVDLQTDVIEDDTMKEMLKEIKQRVHSMALVHEKLYHAGDLANVEFSDYTNSLLNSLWRTHKTEKLNVRLDPSLEPIHLPVTMAVPCGLILNELISNAFTHAFQGRTSGKVSITLGVDDRDKVRLTVRDDGIGLPAEKDWRQATSLGLRLVLMLAKQLHAAVEVKNDSGTEFIIAFERPKL